MLSRSSLCLLLTLGSFGLGGGPVHAQPAAPPGGGAEATSGRAQERAERAQPRPAADPSRLRWRPEWRRAGRADAMAIASLGAGALASSFAASPERPRWRGGILFDDAIRSALGASGDRRLGIADLSDILLWTSAAYPLLTGPGLALVIDSNPEVA
ncbi:MAG: hypothetical protein OEY14_13850, partial [Myxococcales bacterium]|nr:hypothetical protein [Myxococcales bacterium]